jgi:hypothetical protein
MGCVVQTGSGTGARSALRRVIGVFLSAIEGNAVEVTNENVNDLWALCDEF